MSILQYCALILYLVVSMSCPHLHGQPQTVAYMVQTAHNTQIGQRYGQLVLWRGGEGETEEEGRGGFRQVLL
jgi:hypothetical protein